MAKILFVNSVCGIGSTGRICTDLYDLAEKNNYECCIAYGRIKAPKKYNTLKIGNIFNVYVHVLLSRIFDMHGFGSKIATKRFLKKVDKYQPDIIHLHNIHGYYINVKCLFDYLKKHPQIKVVWTLHDCWPFTGHCAYFTYANCNNWIHNECRKCKYKYSYPKCSLKSNSYKNYIHKYNNFVGVQNLTIVTPSKWLKNLVDQSFLQNYDVNVINNGIDLNYFYKEKLNVESKINILAIANVWEKRKGLDEIIKLSQIIDYDKFNLIVVGISNSQSELFPRNVITIERTKDIHELRKIYNNADLLFNPTKEDNYPTVNLEAQACGTPVITYDIGGTKETLFSKESKIVKDFEEFIHMIENFDFKKNKKDINVDLAFIDKNVKMKEYIDLYDKILDKGK